MNYMYLNMYLGEGKKEFNACICIMGTYTLPSLLKTLMGFY